MSNEKANPAMHFFLYMLHFFSLLFISLGLGNILFQAINKFFPDSAVYSYQGFFDQSAVKFGIAAIFVAAPLFFFTAKLIVQYLFEGKIDKDSKVRKWMTYVVLFLASATIVGDLIALIVSFLNGDIVARFALKILTILVIAGSIFTYYFWDIRREEIKGKKFKENRIAFWVSISVICAVFIFGFFIIDGPKVSREKKMDSQAVGSIQAVDSSLQDYFISTEKLPESLDQLKNTKFNPLLSKEGVVIYQKTGENIYQLCAYFNHSNLDEKDRYQTDPYLNQWVHAQGKVCFDRIAIENRTKQNPL